MTDKSFVTIYLHNGDYNCFKHEQKCTVISLSNEMKYHLLMCSSYTNLCKVGLFFITPRGNVVFLIAKVWLELGVNFDCQMVKNHMAWTDTTTIKSVLWCVLYRIESGECGYQLFRGLGFSWRASTWKPRSTVWTCHVNDNYHFLHSHHAVITCVWNEHKLMASS